MDDSAFQNFPVNGILPKKETGALAFLAKYPEYDGSGVVIAILDTGVDPGAPGLQVTPDGRPKIVDLIDATGSGDVDISTVREPDADGWLTTATGRRLRVPAAWQNPSGKFHCGYKALYELYAEPLRERIKKKRKEAVWQAGHDEAVAQVQQRLKELSAKTSSTGGESSGGSKTDELLKSLQKEDLQAQLDALKDLECKIKDVGPVYDCLVWQDASSTWRACVVDLEDPATDVTKAKVLTTYRDSFEYATFGYEDMFNYSVTILPDERILQLVTDSGSHGTHVASIAAGYHPDKPELNGVAPGARIVGIKIGDIRVNGMETGFALANACRYLLQHKVDLTNFSFGEPVHFINSSPAMRIAEEMVEKHGIIFCGSAGNNGPGFMTTNAPASCSRSAISVGAYVTAEMLKAEHSVLGAGAGTLFTWSSRGPQLDGQLGVTVCAPGGAFAAVPNWTQRGQQLMSGTSMSSPNLCGCLALVLSGLKKSGVAYTPYGVKRALENTSVELEEALGGGAGLVQVDKAFDYMVKHRESLYQQVLFDVKVTQGARSLRGLLLKNADEVSETRDYQVTIEPIFFEKWRSETDSAELLKLQQARIALSGRLALVCEPNASEWLEHPAHLYLVNSSRQFFVRVHADRLQEGQAYFTQLKAFDVDDPGRACLFRVPITVIKPHTFNPASNNNNKGYELSFNGVGFKQGQIKRHFIRVPVGATHAELSVSAEGTNDERGHVPFFHVQCFVLDNIRNAHKTLKEDYYRLNTSNEFKHLFKTLSNKVVQVAIGKNWSNVGSVTVNYRIKFRGLLPALSHEVLCLSAQPARLDVASLLAHEECDPTISWKFQVQTLKPTENTIELVVPGSETTGAAIKPVYQIVLTYSFHQAKSEEVSCEVPLLSDYLYESEYQSVFWSIYEANTKRHMLSGDAFPVIYKYKKSLDKGDYTVRLYVRHNKVDMLEKLKELPINLRRAISSQTANEICNSYLNVMKGVKKTGAEKIARGSEATFYVTPLQDDKLPKGITAGQMLLGELTLFKDAAIGKIDNHRISYVVNAVAASGGGKKDKTEKAKSAEKAKSSSGGGGGGCLEESPSSASLSSTVDTPVVVVKSEKTKGDEEKMREALRDLHVSWVLKSNDVFDKVRKDYENWIPLYVNRVNFLAQKLASATDDAKPALCDSIVELSRLAIGKINQDDLLRYLGEKQHDGLSDEAKKELDNQKGWMIELLVQQGVALVERAASVPPGDSDSSSAGQELADIVAVYRSLQRYIDITDDKATKFTQKFYTHRRLYGKALKALLKQNDDKPATPATEQAILEVLKQMKLDYAVKYHQNALVLNSPKNFWTY